MAWPLSGSDSDSDYCAKEEYVDVFGDNSSDPQSVDSFETNNNELKSQPFDMDRSVPSRAAMRLKNYGNEEEDSDDEWGPVPASIVTTKRGRSVLVLKKWRVP